jgi:carbon-monoxide dehydrogenase medium subunit
MHYERPSSLKDAISLLAKAKSNAFVLAGGSDLLVNMKNGLVEPGLIVDIKSIKGFGEIRETASGFAIGAAVSCAAMGESAALKKAWPGVVEAANLIGSTQVQGRCTVAGNLCNASPAADAVPAMVVAGARAVVAGPKGKREVAVEEIPAGPGKTTLKKGELIEAIVLPKKPARTGDAYLRFIPRSEMDIAAAGVGVCLTLDGTGKCTAARVALGAVGPKVIDAKAAAKALIGTECDDAALDRLAAAASAAASPIDDKRGTVAFRKDVTGVLARRAAKIALERARG